ncbi:hypothetical protein [Christiangramia sp. SM2212]|uniref:Lipocalin-like domain-containing protein n=1 Tax=Christiangramia sediminicola TaxID=3073267 RepID=A0ABU1EL41_9FLAO|nr:hypothetical protein [Christiangramia sp. SM2212]MDR5589102.1 hypothetical protein [Christiangramia sp. SM2212]
MKKISILFLLINLFFLSCSDDDVIDSNNQLKIEKTNLIGTWKSIETSDHSGSEFELFRLINQDDQYSLTFLSDDTFINTSTPLCDGIYLVEQEDRQLILSYEAACSTSQSSSTISSLTINELILTRSGGDEAFKIKFEKE